MEAKGSKIQAVEQKYGLDKYAKTEFIKHIIKEFTKVDDKLVRIAKAETLKKEELTADKIDLLSRKDKVQSHLEGLKIALDVYKKAYGKGGEGAAIPANLAAEPEKDNKAEIEAKANEIVTAAAKKLSYLFIAARIVQDKEKTSTNPLVYLTGGEQADLIKLYKEITRVHEEKDITIADEVNNAAEALLHFIKNEPHTGLEISKVSTTISNIMNDNSAISKKFRMNTPKSVPVKEYGTTQSISVGKDVPVEAPKKEQPIHEAAAPKKEEPIKPKEPEVTVPVQKPQEAPAKPEQKWGEVEGEDEEEGEYDEGEYEGEEEKPSYVPAAPVPIKEAEFEIATSKSEERKKRLEEGQRRGRSRGGRYGRRGGRGFYGGRRGGRGGPRRGRGESGPQSSAPAQ